MMTFSQMNDLQNDMTSMGKLNTTDNGVHTKLPSGRWKLVKLENIQYLVDVGFL